ncbi:pre-rRNA-processing protein esf1 [Tripterygium wilfordii]|uniref:Pre-rRNA-processing protein esf1 n=1 Tax=Tripterygium wilfordii TaxID=458696 RepID=A0A7J7CPB2_TRIWF|nr:pre-rRNA-processing protein esf1 [Tripterygium wilfordii]KAF5735917.1 pre-rRNA-processing protein esf1 [Tripterygium wilfordii]
MGSKNAEDQKKRKKKHGKNDGHESTAGKIVEDSRFASVHSDPRFQKVPKHKTKVAIDSRFDRMFTDKNFGSSSAPLDKRGKRKKQKSGSSLRHYYRIDEEGEGKSEEKGKIVSSRADVEEEGESESEEESRKVVAEVAVSSSTDQEDDEEEETEDEEEERDGYESTTEEEVDEELVQEDEIEVPMEDIPVIEKETRRLAVVNMDWNHVKAVDLYATLSSFVPKDRQIMSVSVYPSEFGLQRMKEEDVRGPVGIFDDENKSSDEDDEIDEGKLRAYERSRLRYYYAVVECDSVATADYLYSFCDGLEFERSSNVLDLRFIPESMEFKHPPRDVATEVPVNYEGLHFHTRALQQSKVHISWDEDEPHRVKTLNRKFNADQLAELELKEFLASDESETDDDENDEAAEDQSDVKYKKRDKYRALVQAGDGSDEDGDEEGQDMEVTFNTRLEDLSKRILEKKDKESETVWEAYLRKRREKKKSRKNKSKYSSEDDSSDADQEPIEQPDDFFIEEPSAKKSKKDRHVDTDIEAEASKAELELLLADDKGADTGLKGYNLKPKMAKGKKGRDVPDEDKIPTGDFDDPRFSALFSSHLYALDPTDPQFKRSAAHARLMAQRQKKTDRQEGMEPKKADLLLDEPRLSNDREVASDAMLKKDQYELSSLVKSVKMKSQQVPLLPKGKTSKTGEKYKSAGIKGMGNHELSTLVQSVKKKAKGGKK